jgi:hypothetical protein
MEVCFRVRPTGIAAGPHSTRAEPEIKFDRIAGNMAKLPTTPLTRDRQVIAASRAEVEWLGVRLDGKAFRSPAIEAAFQKFDSQKPSGESPMQDELARLVTRTSAINDKVGLGRKQRWICAHLIGCKPPRARDDYRSAQQVQWLANINN